MTMIWEKIVVTAREFLSERNINDCKDLNEPFYQAKLQEFDWDPQFSAAAILCEIVWKISIGGRDRVSEWRQLDRLFSISPVATHANFRGARSFKTGNIPERGSMAVWKRGNTCQGHIAIVTNVASDISQFDTIDARALSGSEGGFIKVEERLGKMVGLPFKSDKLNLLGFIYPPNREI